MEKLLFNDTSESCQFINSWHYVHSGSIYATRFLSSDEVLIGGSTWDRKNTPFNGQTRNSSGETVLLKIDGNSCTEQRRIVFPSMVNAIVPIANNVFVGCKRDERSLNLFNSHFELITSLNDELGGGVYNAAFHEQTRSVLVATRNGWLESLSPDTLLPIKTLELNRDNSRLWSLAIREDGLIAVGDYSGRLFVVDPNMERVKIFNMFNFISHLLPDEQKVWEPSVFGLTINNEGQIIASIRWGQITWFNYEAGSLQAVKSVIIPEEISHLFSIDEIHGLLIGTRPGRLLYYHSDMLIKDHMDSIIYIPPSLQADNSIWSISRQGNNILVCFSDGQVVNFNIV